MGQLAASQTGNLSHASRTGWQEWCTWQGARPPQSHFQGPRGRSRRGKHRRRGGKGAARFGIPDSRVFPQFSAIALGRPGNCILQGTPRSGQSACPNRRWRTRQRRCRMLPNSADSWRQFRPYDWRQPRRCATGRRCADQRRWQAAGHPETCRCDAGRGAGRAGQPRRTPSHHPHPHCCIRITGAGDCDERAGVGRGAGAHGGRIPAQRG